MCEEVAETFTFLPFVIYFSIAVFHCKIKKQLMRLSRCSWCLNDIITNHCVCILNHISKMDIVIWWEKTFFDVLISLPRG